MYPPKPCFKPCKFLPKPFNIANLGTRASPEQGAIQLDFAEGYGIPINRRSKSVFPNIVNSELIYNKSMYGNSLYFDGIDDYIEYNNPNLNIELNEQFALNIRFRIVDFPSMPVDETPNSGAVVQKINSVENKGFFVACQTFNNEGTPSYAIICGVLDGVNEFITVLWNGTVKNTDFHHLILVNITGLGCLVLFDDVFANLGDITDWVMQPVPLGLGALRLVIGEDIIYGYYGNVEIANLAFARNYQNPSELNQG